MGYQQLVEKVIDRAYEPSQRYICAMEKEIFRIMGEGSDFLEGRFEVDGDFHNYEIFLNSYKLVGNQFSEDYQKAFKNEKQRIESQINLGMVYVDYSLTGPLRMVSTAHMQKQHIF